MLRAHLFVLAMFAAFAVPALAAPPANPAIESVEFGDPATTIHGSGFTEVTEVSVSGTPVASFTVVNDQTISFAGPDLDPGVYRLTVAGGNPRKAATIDVTISEENGDQPWQQVPNVGAIFYGSGVSPDVLNVGINTTDPQFNLDVHGYVKVRGLSEAGAPPGRLDADNIQVTGPAPVGGGGTVFSTFGNASIGGDLGVTGDCACNSDVRLKKNVATIDGALAKVLGLRGVRFDWRRDEFPGKNFPAGPKLGFVAQEVERVLPEVVKTEADGFKAIAYQNLTAVLVEAVKEQNATIERQRAELDALRKEMAELRV